MATQYSLYQKEELIDIAEEKSRNFWALKLGVSIERLKSAVRATHSLDYENIKKYFHKNKTTKIYNI